MQSARYRSTMNRKTGKEGIPLTWPGRQKKEKKKKNNLFNLDST